MIHYVDWNLIIGLATAVIAILGAQWKVSSWLAGQFKQFRDLIDNIKNEIVEKLDYHERHDDQRFSQLADSIWLLRLRNAAKDGAINGTDQWSEKQKKYLKNEETADSLLNHL